MATTTTSNNEDYIISNKDNNNNDDPWLWLIDSRRRRLKLPPLGSMTRTQWDDYIGAMRRLVVLNSNKKNREDGQLDGYTLLNMDRMVRRLIAEHATLSRLQRLERTPTLVAMLTDMSDYWLQLLSLQQYHHFHHHNSNKNANPLSSEKTTTIPLERAERAWRVLMEWKNRGWFQLQQLPPLEEEEEANNDSGNGRRRRRQVVGRLEETFLAVLQAWIQLDSPQGMERAAHLLLWKDNYDCSSSSSTAWSSLSFSPDQLETLHLCFHQVLTQSVQFNTVEYDPLESFTTQLLHRMQQLHMELGAEWENYLQEIEKEADQCVDMAEDTSFSSSGSITGEEQLKPQQQYPQQPQSVVGLSSLELQELQKKILQGIHRAGVQDRNVVEQLIEQWNHHHHSRNHSNNNDSLTSELAAAMANFYIRIEEPTIATQWLLRVNNNNNNNSNSSSSRLKQEVMPNLIRLWVSRPEEEAPWRADELLESLEQDAQSSSSSSLQPALDSTTLYEMVILRWLQSTTTGISSTSEHHQAGIIKAVQLCHRCWTTTSKPVKLQILKAVLSFLLQQEKYTTQPMDDDDDELISLIFEVSCQSMAFYDNNDEEQQQQQLSLVLDDLLELVGRSKWLSSQNPLELLSALDQIKNIRPLSSKMCQVLLLESSFSKATNDPEDVLSLLQRLEEMGASTMSFECYQAAIRSILTFREKPILIEALLGVFSRLVNDKSVNFKENGIQCAQLTLEVMDVILANQRPDDAVTALQLLEQVDARLFPEVRSNPSTSKTAIATPQFFPSSLMECYRKVATTLFKSGDYDKVIEIFYRLREHAARTDMLMTGGSGDGGSGEDDDHRRRHELLLLEEDVVPIPDSNFYNLCMAALSKQQQDVTSNINNLEKQEELLEELIQRYKLNQDSRLKPLPSMYIGIILNLKKANANNNINNNCSQRALKWLDSMIELQVQPRDALPFSTVMHILLQDKKRSDQTFRAVVSVYDRMTVEPDSYTLYAVMAACSRAETIPVANSSTIHSGDNAERHRAKATKSSVSPSPSALQIALDTLSKIREKGWASEAPYNSMLDVLLSSRQNHTSSSDDVVVDIQSTAKYVFELCCADGYLTNRIKRSFEIIFPAETWKDLYHRQLQGNNQNHIIIGEERKAWSRHVTTKS